MQLLLPQHTDKNVSMIPLPRGGNTHSGNAVADRANHVLSEVIPAGEEYNIIEIQGVIDELESLSGHDFWQKFRMVCNGLCKYSGLFKQEKEASRGLAVSFITTLNTVALRDVKTSFAQKRERGDDGYNPFDKKDFFYSRRYNPLYEKILEAYGHNPDDTSLQQELQSLRKAFSDQLEASIEQYEWAESLEYFVRLYQDIADGTWVAKEKKEDAYHAFKWFRKFIYTLEDHTPEEQSAILRSLPFIPGDFPFAMNLEGIKQLRDAIVIFWAGKKLKERQWDPAARVESVVYELNKDISHFGVRLEDLGYTVRKVRKLLGLGRTIGYELKEVTTSKKILR